MCTMEGNTVTIAGTAIEQQDPNPRKLAYTVVVPLTYFFRDLTGRICGVDANRGSQEDGSCRRWAYI